MDKTSPKNGVNQIVKAKYREEIKAVKQTDII